MTCHHRIDGCSGLIGHMHNINFGCHFQALHRQVGGGSNARRCITEGRFLGSLYQLRQSFGSYAGIDREDVGRFGTQCHRHKVFQSVVARIGIE